MSAMSRGWGNFFMVMSALEMEWWQLPEGLEQILPGQGCEGKEVWDVSRVFAIPDLQETRSTCQEWAGRVSLQPGQQSG